MILLMVFVLSLLAVVMTCSKGRATPQPLDSCSRGADHGLHSRESHYRVSLRAIAPHVEGIFFQVGACENTTERLAGSGSVRAQDGRCLRRETL